MGGHHRPILLTSRRHLRTYFGQEWVNSLASKSTPAVHPSGAPVVGSNQSLGLTVRVEINLPADGSKETYDAIFKSIKKNLLGG
jgi:hypothetical protein